MLQLENQAVVKDSAKTEQSLQGMVQNNLERANNQYNGSTKQVLDGSLSAEEIKAKELLNKTDIEGQKGEIVDKFNNTSDSTIISTKKD